MHEEIHNYQRTRRILCRIFFKPTRTFLLTNDSKIILERKKDLSPDQLEKFTMLYARLADEYSFDRIRTDSSARTLAVRFVGENIEDIVRIARR
jgi:hypothetical protein